MARGAVLIGIGFLPTQADVEAAFKDGYIKNCDRVSTDEDRPNLDSDGACMIYVVIEKREGWDYPGDLQTVRFTTSDGRQMWSVYPSRELTSEETAAGARHLADLDAVVDKAFDAVFGEVLEKKAKQTKASESRLGFLDKVFGRKKKKL